MRIENTEQGDQVELVHDRLAAVALQRAQATQQRADEAQRLRRDKDAAEMELLKQRARTAEIAEERAGSTGAADDALRASRRARRLTIALSGVLVLALWAATLAWISTRDARRDLQRLNDNIQKLNAFAAADTAAAKQAADSYQKALDAAAKAKEAAEMALNKTGAGQQQAAALLSDANRSYRSAAQDTQQLMKCPVGKRFYPHVGQDADKGIVDSVVPALRAAGFIVAPVQVVKAEAMPASTAVRYFRKEDQAGAMAAVTALQNAGVTNVTTAFLPGYENSPTVRPCHYELWLAVGAGKG